MLADPISTELATPGSKAENAQHHLRVLHRLIDLGASLAERIQRQPVNHAEQIAAGLSPTADPATAISIAFDRTARGVRRGILLAQHIQDPPARHAGSPPQHRALVRQRILRVVEDEIQAKFDGEAAETMCRELLERLDSPELEDEIGTRPTDEIITDIRRDLGAAGMPGYRHSWKRRTPEDVAQLHAQARRPTSAGPPPYHDPPPPW